jgi:hypothetical protein
MLVEIDVRDVLPLIAVPTLIVHRSGDAVAQIEGARYMAERIPNARLVELTGDHSPVTGDPDAIVDEIEEFVTGRRAERAPDRVFATVMFTDIVESTPRAAAMGDRRWSELLEACPYRRARSRARGTGRGPRIAHREGPGRRLGPAVRRPREPHAQRGPR